MAFTNHGIELLGAAAIAMGTYVFTCATTGEKARVEFTFGYRRNDDGKGGNDDSFHGLFIEPHRYFLPAS